MRLKFEDEILRKLKWSESRFPAFNSEHEGYAIILEQMDELWESIRLDYDNPERKDFIKSEAIGVAATIHRFLNCLCD